MTELLGERRRRLLRDEVGRVAIRLFAEHGFDTVTVDDIAAAAGTSPLVVPAEAAWSATAAGRVGPLHRGSGMGLGTVSVSQAASAASMIASSRARVAPSLDWIDRPCRTVV